MSFKVKPGLMMTVMSFKVKPGLMMTVFDQDGNIIRREWVSAEKIEEDWQRIDDHINGRFDLSNDPCMLFMAGKLSPEEVSNICGVAGHKGALGVPGVGPTGLVAMKSKYDPKLVDILSQPMDIVAMTNNTTIEDAALVICKFGKNSTLSSEKAAEKILYELNPGNCSSRDAFEAAIPKIQELVKAYRHGVGLEETTKAIVKITSPYDDIKPSVDPFPFTTGLNFKHLLAPVLNNPFSSPVHRVGDLVHSSAMSVLPDSTWLWCDGLHVYEYEYPDLYFFLRGFSGQMYGVNCTYNYVFSSIVESFTGKTKFILPFMADHMIKAKL